MRYTVELEKPFCFSDNALSRYYQAILPMPNALAALSGCYSDTSGTYILGMEGGTLILGRAIDAYGFCSADLWLCNLQKREAHQNVVDGLHAYAIQGLAWTKAPSQEQQGYMTHLDLTNSYWFLGSDERMYIDGEVIPFIKDRFADAFEWLGEQYTGPSDTQGDIIRFNDPNGYSVIIDDNPNSREIKFKLVNHNGFQMEIDFQTFVSYFT